MVGTRLSADRQLLMGEKLRITPSSDIFFFDDLNGLRFPQRELEA